MYSATNPTVKHFIQELDTRKCDSSLHHIALLKLAHEDDTVVDNKPCRSGLLGATRMIPQCAMTHIQPSLARFLALDNNLPAARLLAISAMHLLGACSFLARLMLNLAYDFLHSTFNLVLHARLAFVVGSWGAFLCDASSRARLGSIGLGLLGSGALARRLGGDGGYDSRLGVAGCAAGGGHCWCLVEVKANVCIE
jgi:hypothetical protein